jgi:predicted transcriptional regulator
LSLAQNVDELFFGNDATLKAEFDELYTALFNNADQYLAVVKLLSENKRGLTCAEIAKALNFNGGKISSIIKNLERSDIIV